MKIDLEKVQGKYSFMTFRKTAKTFLAASLFMEVLSVFGDLEPDIAEKIKYSKFKATEIMKALKAGKTPSPGGPLDQEITTLEESKNQDFLSSPVNDDQDNFIKKSPTAPQVTDQLTYSNKETAVTESGLDYKTIQQAQKFAKFAISALQYDDVNNAIENLTNALNLLR